MRHERHRAIRRSLVVLQMLVIRPRTLTELSAETGVCRRTIYRDIAALEQAGFPITIADDLEGREQHWRVLPCQMTTRILSAVRPGTLAVSA